MSNVDEPVAISGAVVASGCGVPDGLPDGVGATVEAGTQSPGFDAVVAGDELDDGCAEGVEPESGEADADVSGVGVAVVLGETETQGLGRPVSEPGDE